MKDRGNGLCQPLSPSLLNTFTEAGRASASVIVTAMNFAPSCSSLRLMSGHSEQ
jgi:hypothetical protein